MPNPIKSIRLAAGLTQEQCAEIAGVRQSHWHTIEHRDTLESTPIGTLRRVAEALGVPLERLIGGIR